MSAVRSGDVGAPKGAQATVDVHAHVLTERMIERLVALAPDHAPRIAKQGAAWSLTVEGIVVDTPATLWDLSTRLAEMDRRGVDVHLLSVVPLVFGYNLDPRLAARLAAAQNDELADIVAASNGRFRALTTVPLQDPRLAAAELRRGMEELGLSGVEIGTNVLGRNLDDPALDPFWAAAEDLRAFVFVHAANPLGGDRLANYELRNLVGYPAETAAAIASMILGGALSRHPHLILCFGHGGGSLPYQLGRLVQGWERRPGARVVNETQDPRTLFRSLYFDTVVHDRAALQLLLELAGPDRLLLGSDFPFDMGLDDPIGSIRALDASDAQRTAIVGGTVLSLLS
jgi:aminocarboxymuconate-semialdehyde decarboxylase